MERRITKKVKREVETNMNIELSKEAIQNILISLDFAKSEGKKIYSDGMGELPNFISASNEFESALNEIEKRGC